MTDKTRFRRRAWQVGALAFLLPVALGTGAGAQTPTPQAMPVVAPQVVRSPLPIAADFNVAQMESLAQSLVAGQKVPGLAMAIVHKGRVISARGYGITDASTTRRPCTPRTQKSGATTLSSSTPMRQVPTGW